MIIEDRERHKEEVCAMWQRNFHDPAPYAEFYFTEVYGKNEILLNLSGDSADRLMAMEAGRDREGASGELPEAETGEIRGMLHLNPYRLFVRGKEVDAHYIVGVATDEEYRRQGVMRELLADTFHKLRERGEMLTYLMPADRDYYLPFDFRFGMCQLEQEIECFGQAGVPAYFDEFRFAAGLPEDVEAACRAENATRVRDFAICTEITPEYLSRMEKEARSDFARYVSVYQNGAYAGRFVMGAENDCLVLSQIVCVDRRRREEFLYGALSYCEQEYHYGRYQLVLDETWRDVLWQPGSYDGVRILPVKEKPIIMFRILDLEKLGASLESDSAGDDACRIFVKDAFFDEQEGSYLLQVKGSRVSFEKMSGGQTDNASAGVPDGGSVTIGALTELLFGRKEDREEKLYKGLTPEGRRILESLRPLCPVCIQEIV